ncbi:uncharacterized protein LOC131629000 [Vicia villosa]|uniref:uncharacterized protein LOC131629000 n=1 Tax=Vicia villosa TaxID=3911 RepID=UPI00273B2253|nr:uncharacterized protein LOC131629000 [Vicia villosa]
MDEYLIITIHHSGEFASEDLRVYVGGQIAKLRVDADKWSFFELLGSIKELGYRAIENIYYKDPTGGMNILVDDRGALEIADLYRVHLSVEVFIKHALSQAVFADEAEVVLDDIPLNEMPPNEIVDEVAVEIEEILKEFDERANDVAQDDVRSTDVTQDGERANDVAQDDVRTNDVTQDGERANDVAQDDVRTNDVTQDDERARDVAQDDVNAVGADNGLVGGEVDDDLRLTDDSSDDSNFEYDSAMEIVFDDDSDEYSTELEEEDGMDCDIEDNEQMKSKKGKQMSDENKEDSKGSDNDSEDLGSDCDSDDSSRARRKKCPIFKLLKDMSNYRWEVGTYFTTKEDFKEAIVTYAVHSGRDLRFTKNDKIRVRVRCKDGCEWESYCAKFPTEDSWQLRKVVDTHSCSREYHVKLLKTKWLSKRLQNSLKTNPRLKLKDIKEKVQKKWNVGVNKTKAIRARFAARDMVDGSFLGDYTRVYDYAHELLRSNPGSTVKVCVQPAQEGSTVENLHFKRLYICLAACKESFKWSRHFIGLDGCFLKGLCGGQILAAIGRDPNDQMLPIAFAVVESENKDSWTWFLELLIDDLGGREECLTYTFISDQQKGLLPAMEELLPRVEQRFCVRHLYNNFRKRFAGKKLKEIIWKAAKSTYYQAWEREMKVMKEVNVEAYKHMMSTPPRFWSRSYFKTHNKCDAVLNNMSEAFNSVILESRAKPLITMVEEIRVYMMERWATNRMRFQKLEDVDVLPNIKKKIEKTSSYTNMWLVRMSDEFIFEVRNLENNAEKFTVNLKDRTCSCRRWELTGLPCVHSLSAIKSRNQKIDDYVPEYYRKSRYMQVYQPVIFPVNGSNLWERTEYPDVLPPKFRKMPGRPKKRRNLEQGELDGTDRKMRRTGFIVKCSRCKKQGHNKLTCKVPSTTAQAAPSQAASSQTTSVQVSQTAPSAPSQSSQAAPSQSSQAAPSQSSQAQKTTPKSAKKTTPKAKKLAVRRPNAPFIPPGPTTRLTATKIAIGPTTRRTTPTKRATPKWKP